MTVIAGGPFTWMYLLPDGVLARLTVAFVGEHDEAVRLSYPGSGAFQNETGLWCCRYAQYSTNI